MFVRKCPDCNSDIEYKSKRGFDGGTKNNTSCRICASNKTNRNADNNQFYGKKYYERNGDAPIWSKSCPKCKENVIYKHKNSMLNAIKKNSICKKCSATMVNKNKDFKGEKNPNYGKRHSEETREKMKGRKWSEAQTRKMSELYKGKVLILTEEQEQKRKNSIKNRVQRPYMDVWVEKYGEEGAKQRHKEFLLTFIGRKRTFSNKQGSSSTRGWSGWYKGFFFRSFLELSYIINTLERNNIRWETAEDPKYKIPYIFDGKDRNYYPDFIINEKTIVECKSEYEINSDIVVAKTEAATIWCKNNNYEYTVITENDIDILTRRELVILFKEGLLKFIKGREDKFVKKYLYKNDLLEYYKRKN